MKQLEFEYRVMKGELDVDWDYLYEQWKDEKLMREYEKGSQ